MHRDVKPSNIVLRRDGRALLLDFGLASLAGDEGLTRTGSQLGSLPWMAPEIVRGASDVSWARADVYALGATLYELCALRRAFSGANAQDLSTRILEGRCEPLRRRNPRVGRDLAIVCATAMEPDPARRYASAGALARDLENVLALRPIEARPPGPALRALRFAQRHPAASAALALGAAVAVGGPLNLRAPGAPGAPRHRSRGTGRRARPTATCSPRCSTWAASATTLCASARAPRRTSTRRSRRST
jgi:hypothetical protein